MHLSTPLANILEKYSVMHTDFKNVTSSDICIQKSLYAKFPGIRSLNKCDQFMSMVLCSTSS